jgi:hypothetical protein
VGNRAPLERDAVLTHLIRRVPGGRRAVCVVFLGPLVVLVIWWAGAGVLQWLFAR